MAWVLGVLCLSAPLLVVAAFLITLSETDEVLDDSLRQTALLLADRDLTLGPSIAPVEIGAAQTESKLVAIATRAMARCCSRRNPSCRCEFIPRRARRCSGPNEATWHVYTVLQADRDHPGRAAGFGAAQESRPRRPPNCCCRSYCCWR